MQLGSLFEIVIYVRDMQRALRFYRDKLDLPVSWPATREEQDSAEHWVTFATDGAILALHSGGEATRGTASRFGLRSSDIHNDRLRLLELGVECGEVRSAAPGVWILDCIDSEGNGFFLDQRELEQA